MLSSISSLYYRPRLPHLNHLDVYVSHDYDRLEYSTLDTLLSPLRRPSPLDDWTPLQIALFEAGICCYGKDFHAISRLIAAGVGGVGAGDGGGGGGGKTCGECVDFYYIWKKSGHYAMWKEFGKPVRRRAEGKGEALRVVQEKMRGWGGGAGGGDAVEIGGGEGERGGTAAGKRKREEEGEANGNGEEKRVKSDDAPPLLTADSAAVTTVSAGDVMAVS